MTRPVVEATGLRKVFDGTVAVDSIDFSVEQGECFGFLGPNGAGKTTTMRMVYGISPPSGGKLRVLGMDVAGSERDVRRRIGVVPQESNLDGELTVEENLRVYGRFFDLPAETLRKRAARLLRFMELEGKRGAMVDTLSGGMRQRLLIARALLHRPAILLLDEPTTGLDPQVRHLIWDNLRELKRGGTTLLLTTHYMEEAAQLCDRLVIMDGGRIIAHGAPAALVGERVGREVVEVRAPAGDHRRILEAAGGLARSRDAHGDLLVLGCDSAGPLLARIGTLHAGAVATRRATLEDLFLALTGRRLVE